MVLKLFGGKISLGVAFSRVSLELTIRVFVQYKTGMEAIIAIGPLMLFVNAVWDKSLLDYVEVEEHPFAVFFDWETGDEISN